MFVIRHVNLSDPFNFLGSPNMFSIAEQQGLWNASQPFDWTAVYSAGEYGHRYYSGRRMWRFLSLASEQQLPDTYVNLKNSSLYPTTIAAAFPVDVAFFASVLRDFYNGTKCAPPFPRCLCVTLCACTTWRQTATWPLGPGAILIVTALGTRL